MKKSRGWRCYSDSNWGHSNLLLDYQNNVSKLLAGADAYGTNIKFYASTPVQWFKRIQVVDIPRLILGIGSKSVTLFMKTTNSIQKEDFSLIVVSSYPAHTWGTLGNFDTCLTLLPICKGHLAAVFFPYPFHLSDMCISKLDTTPSSEKEARHYPNNCLQRTHWSPLSSRVPFSVECSYDSEVLFYWVALMGNLF